MGMTPERWHEVKAVVEQALERVPAERGAFLDEACGQDAALRQEVESLLKADAGASGFLEPSAAQSLAEADLHDRLAAALSGRYRLRSELGRGGMATVYLAQDLRHDRLVALKVLHPELAEALGPERRFLREIKTAARLEHPHILPVLDSGETQGLLWYTMPYVEGESLRDRLRREVQLPVEEAVRLTREVADALAYAHAHGVLHRDIKPENILLSGGHARVADFGIAKALEAAGGETLTVSGVLVGTPAYMSPEQAAGERELDGRSDVYSLGCVLYELLAGEPPWRGPTPLAVIAHRFTQNPPPLGAAREGVPAGLEQAVTKALARTPADRFHTTVEFAQALAVAAATPPPALAPQALAVSTVTGPPAVRRRRLPPGLAVLGLGFLLGLGILFARLHTRLGDETADPKSHSGGDHASAAAKRLAVLPFENLGDSADAYFADGVANDLRTKLSQVAGLAVIARSSSNEYRQTKKPTQQIARELGVDYLLTATVQWEKVAGGVSRVRVTPELVDLRPGHAPQTRWGQQFDAAMTSVFQVQADIAAQVARALNVALGDSAKHELAAKPTQSLPAYDAYLRGNAALASSDPASLRRAIAAFEQAVALDSTFVQAWAGLAAVQATLYTLSTPTPALAEATRRAAERALALGPTRPEGHVAMATYYTEVLGDNSRALMELSTALALAPGEAWLLKNMGAVELRLGRWDAARGHLEQAARLDPRSASVAGFLGRALFQTRHYPEAEQALDHALQLEPANLDFLEDRAMVALAQGDLAAAQAVLRATPKEVDPTTLVAYVGLYFDLVWVLDQAQQQLLLRLTPSAFDGDRAVWGIVLAQTYALQGNGAKAQIYADSARLAFTRQLQSTPEDPQRHVRLGLVLAYLGQKAAAIREGERGVALMPISRDAFNGPYYQHQLARIYLLVGEPEKALDQLEPLLKIPYYLSPGWLKIDPNFAPLRGNPRFERLVNGS
jgi:serine/threonine-protein kinase